MSFLGSIAQTSAGAASDVSNEQGRLYLATKTLTLEEKVTQLFEQLRGSVYRYLIIALGDSSEAEDVTQEAFLELYRCLREGQEIREVRFWIFRVAHNLAIKHKLKDKYLVPMDSESWRDICSQRKDSRPDPEQSLIQKEFQKRFQSALQKLSPLQRQCLLLRVEGFKYEQIAKALNTSVSHVAQCLRRGLRTMRKNNHD
ncbi:MAG: RNA polymerase sigma factor [Acidobacteria bacterium]|nr:RNA polymerase sigma factor [Acidobacteriota bacterium]MCI0723854.1 RNA polymerase sigma factor [Acidobacteriota bacterium]